MESYSDFGLIKENECRIYSLLKEKVGEMVWKRNVQEWIFGRKEQELKEITGFSMQESAFKAKRIYLIAWTHVKKYEHGYPYADQC